VSPREGIERGAPRPEGGPNVNWVGDMSQAAIDAARSREVAVVCVGTHPKSHAG
jgi:hypothetical protein